MKMLIVALGFVVVAAAGSVSTQTDWSEGPGVPGPVTGWEGSFESSDGMSWLSVPGQLSLSSEPLSAPVRHDISLSFSGCYCACVGDVNGDGLNDIAATAFNSDAIRIWLADGQGGWTVSTVADRDGALGCDLGDIDGDGDLDILFTSYTPGSVRLFLNLGGDIPQWEEQILNASLHGAHDVKAVDLDDDGDMDVVAAVAEDDVVLWWRNDGGSPIQWTQQTVGSMGYPCRFAVADLDGDGNPDLAGAGFEDDLVGIWYGSGGPSPTWTFQLAESGVVGAHGASARDIDDDGDLDLFIAALAGNEVFWMRNDGGSPIAWAHQDIGSFTGAGCAEAADIDGDGDYDVSCGSFGTAGTAWWENEGCGESWEQHSLGSGMGTFSLARPGDVDMDGDLDVVCCGYSGNRLCWYEVTSFASPGWLESPILDTGCQPQYASMDWDASVPAGSSVSVQFCSSDDASSMGEWSAPFTSPSGISGQVSRYFQYRLALSSEDSSVSPVLRSFSLGYDPTGIETCEPSGFGMQVQGGNPCPGAVSLVVGSALPGTVDVMVFDTAGRLVSRSMASVEAGCSITLPVGPVPPGVYMAVARHSSGAWVLKSVTAL